MSFLSAVTAFHVFIRVGRISGVGTIAFVLPFSAAIAFALFIAVVVAWGPGTVFPWGEGTFAFAFSFLTTFPFSSRVR